MDFFECGYPIKYKRKYTHYLNQRIFYSEEEVEEKVLKPKLEEPVNPNKVLFEETKTSELPLSEGEDEDTDTPPVRFKKTVLTI